MSNSLGQVTEKYLNNRFPNASRFELAKMTKDWEEKLAKSAGVVKDYEERIGRVQNQSILDVGSGNGGISAAFAAAGARMTGIDIEGDLATIATEYASAHRVNAQFLCYDGTIFPFRDRSFDGAISVSVLEHVEDPVVILRETFRVLKSGSCFYLAFPNRIWPKETHTGLWFLSYLPVSVASIVARFFHRGLIKEYNVHFYGYFSLLKWLKRLSHEGMRFTVIEERGHIRTGWKWIVKYLLGQFGFSYKIFLPHIMVILRKE